ncbi:bZIP transcription factor atfB [Aspergillus lucknowensis]|uniref:BZIP domain-containing protein n=1 Tax=Aspergillus lucknowensis TaxID=176173 RepID=A0ABR4LP59_9EURO
MPPRSDGFSNTDELFMPQVANMPQTISTSDMQRLQRPYYPSNVADIMEMAQQDPFALPPEDADMWEPFTTLESIDPSWTITNGPNDMQSLIANTQPSQGLATLKGDAKPQGMTNHLVQHGQVTPPSDDPPHSNSVHPHDLDGSQPAPPQSSIVNQPQNPTRRRRSGGGARGGSGGRAPRGSTSLEPSPEGDDKQEKTRARNRVAASKCRQKQKERNSELEKECKYQEAKKKELMREAARLREEVLKQKNLLLAHSECGHEGIKAYLDGMVKRITTGSGEAPDLGSLDEGYPGSGFIYNDQRPPGPSEPAFGFGFDSFAPSV